MDEWGPKKVLQVYDPDTGMKGILVIDNTSTGPGAKAKVAAMVFSFIALMFSPPFIYAIDISDRESIFEVRQRFLNKFCMGYLQKGR
jgi:hypothetical protein